MALLLLRENRDATTRSAEESSSPLESVGTTIFAITHQQLVDRHEDASRFQRALIGDWPQERVMSIPQYFSGSDAPSPEQIKELLIKHGFSRQSALSKPDRRDFALGLCFRIVSQRSCPPEGLSEEFNSMRLAEEIQDHLGTTRIFRDPKKISRSNLRALIKSGTARSLLERYQVTTEVNSRQEKCDLLYALLWLDPKPHDNDDTINDGTPNQRIVSHQVTGLGSRTTGAITNGNSEVLHRDMDGVQDSVRQIDFANSSNVINVCGKDRYLGNSEPHKCPAMLQTSRTICRKPISHGPYCSVHAKVFPRLKSAETRLLKHVHTSLKELLRMHGYDEITHNAKLSDILTHLLELEGRHQEPWDDLSCTFLPLENSQESDSIRHTDMASSRGSLETNIVLLLSANVDGNYHPKPTELEKSEYIEELLGNLQPTILFLQELNLKKLAKEMDNGRFLGHGNSRTQNALLSGYSLVKPSEKPDVCLLYDKNCFQCQATSVDLTEFFEEKYVRKKTLRSKILQTSPLSERYVGAILKATRAGHEFLCLSYHGFKNDPRARSENFGSTEESMRAFVKAVIGYVREHHIPAVIGGDFNFGIQRMETLCAEMIGDRDVFQLSPDPSAHEKIIDYYLLIHPPHGKGQDTTSLILDDDSAADSASMPTHESNRFNHKPVKSSLILT